MFEDTQEGLYSLDTTRPYRHIGGSEFVKFILASTSYISYPMPQCIGRLVGDTIPFEKGGNLYLLRQCQTITRSTLCDTCSAMETKTKAKKGSMGKSHTAFLIGRVMEPIPDWAHTYGNEWFRLKIAGGYTISEENMAKAKASVASIAAPIPETPVVAKVKRKSRTPAPISAEKVLETLPTVAVVAPPRRKYVKKVNAVTAMGRVEGVVDIGEYEVLHIKVEKKDIDGRIFYLDPKKDKLYDMKFTYVGRFKEGGIAIHPDSDKEV